MSIAEFWNETWTTAMVNHLWQSTALAGVAWLLAIALGKNQARSRYWVWMAASVKFVVPFALFVTVGEWLRSLVAAPRAVTEPAIAAVMQEVAQPFAHTQTSGAASAPVAVHHAEFLPLVLLVVWAFGVAIVLMRWFRGWLGVRVALRAATPIELSADVPAFSTSAAIEPGIFGIFRPLLLMPESILGRLTPSQLDAIVAHEMCHVRRRDNLTFALHMVVEALFWFHPAVWWIGAQLIEERERACDEAVVLQGGSVESYAEGILNVCRFCVESPVACVAGVTGADLKKRIVRIMAEQLGRRLSLGGKLVLGTAGTLILIMPLMLGLVHAQSHSQGATRVAEAAPDATKLQKFDVVLIKPGKPGCLSDGIGGFAPGEFQAFCIPLKQIIAYAYGYNTLHDERMLGGPGWINSTNYYIDAKVDASDLDAYKRLTTPEIDRMLQQMLAERYGLRVHHETRDLQVYALVIAKDGSTLKDAKPGQPSPDLPPAFSAFPGGTFRRGRGKVVGWNAPVSGLLPFLQDELGHTVVDETGLTGKYDYTLTWTPEMMASGRANGGATQDDLGPSIFTALQEELGLKLVSKKKPQDVLVIDHVEEPTPN